MSLDLFFIEIKTEGKHKFSLLYKILKKPDFLITTILVGTNISIVASTQILSKILHSNSILGNIFLFFIFPMIVLIIGEIYPKIICSRFSYTFSKFAVFLFLLFQIILSPIVIVFNLISRFVEFIFIRNKRQIDKNKKEEIKNILAYSLQKKISKIGLFIEDAIKFDEIALYEIQKPLFSYPSLACDEKNNLDISQIYEYSEKNYIVYDINNNFLGILNIDSIFHSGNIKTIYKKNEIPLINNIPVAYEGKNLLVAIELMKKNNSSFLITINEFGQYFGLITKEDLFSFFSNIIISKEDLYKFNIKKVGEKTYIVPGFTELTSLSRAIGFELTDDYYHTFNGYLINQLGKIPKEGEVFIIDNFLEVRIVSANKKFVEKAIVKIIDSKEAKLKND